MKAVIYARYSSLAQNEQSIEEQVKKCQTYALVKHYDIVGTYIDKAKSGSKNIEKRTDFLKMIKDSYTSSFSVLIVYKLDRFSRDEYDTKEYEKILTQNNVRIESATESYDPNTIEGFILKSMLQLISQIMPKQLSSRVKDGMEMNAQKFLSNGGQHILGYDIIDKHFVPNKDADIVRLIFDMKADGEPISNIISTLKKLGYGEFKRSSLYTLLQNKKYIGTYTYKGIETPNAIPPIVDKEIFDKANTTKHIRHQVIPYHLSGKLFYNDNKMTGESAKSGKHRYYRCDNTRIRKDLIESKVMESIKSFLKSDLEEIALSMEEYSKTRSNAKEISRYKRRNQDIDKMLVHYLKLFEKTNDVDFTANKINELKKEKQENIETIKYLERTDFVITKEMTINFLKDFILYDDGSDEFKANLFKKLVKRVDYDGNTCKVLLNLPQKEKLPFGSSSSSILVGEFGHKTYIYL